MACTTSPSCLIAIVDEHESKSEVYNDRGLSGFDIAITVGPKNHGATDILLSFALGLTIDERSNTPDFVLFDTNTIPFALSEAKVNLDEAPQPGWGAALWIDCDQINALHAKMEAAGATIIQQPLDGPFGRTFVFADPDGYRITANENPWDRFPLGGRH